MLGHSSISRPDEAALLKWASPVMDVILHLGAHRTATTSFQDYMRRHAAEQSDQRIGFWGPRRAGRGLYARLMSSAQQGGSDAQMAKLGNRLKVQLERADARGIQKLVVSDANMLGCLADNISCGALYPRAGERMARVARAFDGQITRVLLTPRSLELYWCSALAYGVSQGHPVPTREVLHRIAMSARGWRDVISDVAQAMPGVDVRVLPFEGFAGRPDTFLSRGAQVNAPFDSARKWINRTPTLPELRRVLASAGHPPAALPFGMGKWNPFTNEEHAALREMYADDMMWLTAGADGLATLTEDRSRDDAGRTPPAGTQLKGHCDEPEERQMARPG